MAALLITSPLPFEQAALTAEVTASSGGEVCVCRSGWVRDLLAVRPHMLLYLPSDKFHFSLLGCLLVVQELL